MGIFKKTLKNILKNIIERLLLVRMKRGRMIGNSRQLDLARCHEWLPILTRTRPLVIQNYFKYLILCCIHVLQNIVLLGFFQLFLSWVIFSNTDKRPGFIHKLWDSYFHIETSKQLFLISNKFYIDKACGFFKVV